MVRVRLHFKSDVNFENARTVQIVIPLCAWAAKCDALAPIVTTDLILIFLMWESCSEVFTRFFFKAICNIIILVFLFFQFSNQSFNQPVVQSTLRVEKTETNQKIDKTLSAKNICTSDKNQAYAKEFKKNNLTGNLQTTTM